MEDYANSTQVGSRVLHALQKSLSEAQDILDQNSLLINEISQNHESRMPDNLTRNVGLIRDLNNNVKRVVDIYADLSSSLTKSWKLHLNGILVGL